MEDSIYKKYGIDPNRIPTDAEVELVAYCFGVNVLEARQILDARHGNCGSLTRDGQYKTGGKDGIL